MFEEVYVMGRILDSLNNALDVRYRGNGYYQLGTAIVSDDVQLLRYIANWMQDNLLGPVEGFPVFIAKGGVRSSTSFLLGDYNHRNHNFTIMDEEDKYYRVRLIGKTNYIPPTIIIYKEDWPTIKFFRPYRDSKVVQIPGKETSQTLLFPKMKQITYIQYLMEVKAEYCAIRNMGDPVAKTFVNELAHFADDDKHA